MSKIKEKAILFIPKSKSQRYPNSIDLVTQSGSYVGSEFMFNKPPNYMIDDYRCNIKDFGKQKSMDDLVDELGDCDNYNSDVRIQPGIIPKMKQKLFQISKHNRTTGKHKGYKICYKDSEPSIRMINDLVFKNKLPKRCDIPKPTKYINRKKPVNPLFDT